VTAVQLDLDDCDPGWAPVPKPRPGRRIREREKHDLRGQGLTRRQLDRIRTIRLTGSYL
jgi:hypothetical protein